VQPAVEVQACVEAGVPCEGEAVAGCWGRSVLPSQSRHERGGLVLKSALYAHQSKPKLQQFGLAEIAAVAVALSWR